MKGAFTAAQFPFLSRISPGARSELVALGARRSAPLQLLLQKGDVVDGAYFVVGGSLRVYYITAEGREATLYRVPSGGTCVLAMTASLGDEPYPAWVQAESDGALFVLLPKLVLRRLLDEEAAFRELIFGVLSGRVFELMCTLEEAGTQRVEQRVARHLLRRVGADGSVRASQSGIASDLGTAREVVSRALRSLAARGVVETGRGRVVILDRPELDRLAGQSSRSVT
jgi:CRP/FNR family transcriptional regulator